MKKIRKTGIFLITIVLLLSAIPFTASAECKEYHWYCKHAKNHERPKADASFSFLDEADAYYIDKNEDEKVVYLTFDAGYENGNVAKILDVLKEESVPGAFFILGNLISHDPELVKRMAEEGHIVGNHTVRHRNMCNCNESDFCKELSELETSYKELTGKDLDKYYRPPEGTFSKENLEYAKSMGYKTILWSFGYPDWDNHRQMPEERAKQIVLDNVHNGEVMLLHPTSQTNANILQDVIRELKNQGYRFGTLDELTK